MPLLNYRILSIVLLFIWLTACSSAPTATSDFDSSFDFSGVRKIAIQPIDRGVPASVISSDMQVNRINEAIRGELVRRGFTVVQDNADADLFLAWHLVTQERTDVRSFNTSSRYNCWNCGSDIRVRQYTQGTFIVDMIDPVRLQSVWRSIFEDRIRDLDAEEAAEKRAVVAGALFAEFPPL